MWHLEAATNLSLLTTKEVTHPTQLLYHIESCCRHMGILWAVFLSRSHLSPQHLGGRRDLPHPVLCRAVAWQQTPPGRVVELICCWIPPCRPEHDVPSLMRGLIGDQGPPLKEFPLNHYLQGISCEDTVKKNNMCGKHKKELCSVCCHLISWPLKKYGLKV